jgi:hypothetical protein
MAPIFDVMLIANEAAGFEQFDFGNVGFLRSCINKRVNWPSNASGLALDSQRREGVAGLSLRRGRLCEHKKKKKSLTMGKGEKKRH